MRYDSNKILNDISKPISIFWFRRDLRLDDNHGLFVALKDQYPVLPLFIFDTVILSKLESKTDRRVDFIFNSLRQLKDKLEELGSTLLIFFGDPIEIFEEILKQVKVAGVYANTDYEPYAREREYKISDLLKSRGINLFLFKDQVLFEKNEVLNSSGKPFTVFTPYMKKWKERLSLVSIPEFPVLKHKDNLLKIAPFPMPSIEEIGFLPVSFKYPAKVINVKKISAYQIQRDFPAVDGTSKLSVHLRFGTISIRKLVKKAQEISDTFLNELIWREFYMMILWNFPFVTERSFHKKYENIPWRNNEKEFDAWCKGETGFPIVDAGMRQLNETGYMHNRVRMITASFLTKDLLIDWRWGEAYFASKLLDFELSSNNGGWQWAAGTGVDAAPYFRIFNPWLQTRKFDPELKYIKTWIPDYDAEKYINPIVDHARARERTLKAYQYAQDGYNKLSAI